MIIALASDHAGVEMKDALKVYLAEHAEILDLGTNSDESVDYPDFGKAMGEAIRDGKAETGIVVCGSGIGISIAVNRYKEARCALCMTPDMAELSRLHNNANVLALGARLIDLDTAKEITDTFLNTEFEGGRHERRVDKLSS